jgi:hypothetical protein
VYGRTPSSAPPSEAGVAFSFSHLRGLFSFFLLRRSSLFQLQARGLAFSMHDASVLICFTVLQRNGSTTDPAESSGTEGACTA